MEHKKTYRYCNASDLFISSHGIQCGNCGAIEQKDYYKDGFVAGHADKLLGIDMLITAIESPLNGYSDGYKRGYHS